jgi:hypothetical protein
MKQTSKAGSGIWLAVATTVALLASPWALAQRPVIPLADAPPAAAAAPAIPPAMATERPAEELQELDEVVVTGGRLYDRIVKAEDKFFKLYNELNDDDDFDTNCANVPIDSDSRVEQRFCMPSFFADAKAEQVRLSQYCLSLQEKDEDGNVTSNGACYEPPSAEQLFFHRRNDYVNNMLKVIKSDPDLLKMYQEVEALHRERAAYEHRYDQLRAEKLAEQAEKNKNRPRVR